MKIEESKHSVAELIDLYHRKDPTVNEEYKEHCGSGQPLHVNGK